MANSALCMSSHPKWFDRRPHIAHVVESIKDADNANTVLHGVFDNLDYIVRIVTVAQQVLAAEAF